MEENTDWGKYSGMMGSLVGGFYGSAYAELVKNGIPEDKAMSIANLLLKDAIDRLIQGSIASAIRTKMNENAIMKMVLDNPVGGEQ